MSRKTDRKEATVISASRPLIILRGHMCSGKSTCFKKLREQKEHLFGFVFVDHVAIKTMYSKLGDVKRRENGKIWTAAMVDSCVRDADIRGVVTEEISVECLRNYMTEIPEYHGFNVLVFEFIVSEEIAYQRNIERRMERGLEPRSRENMQEMREKYFGQLEEQERKEAIEEGSEIVVIDTDKMDQDETLRFVLDAIRLRLIGQSSTSGSES